MSIQQPVFAIGDIHGRDDLLYRLQTLIKQETQKMGLERAKVVYLGDYIDRGPNSRGVLDLVLNGLDGFERILLSGNHEDMLGDFLREPEIGNNAEMWFVNGGQQTLESYGLSPIQSLNRWNARKIRDALLAQMPDEHKALILPSPNQLKLFHEDNNAIFVHAGLNPSVDFKSQTSMDMLWIREPFLNSSKNWGKPVVHGHTPNRYGPEIKANRINIDTLAWSTLHLTCVVLDGGEPRFLVASQNKPWQIIIDPKGQASKSWIDWCLSILDGCSGTRELATGLCLPSDLLDMASMQCIKRGIQHKSLPYNDLLESLNDTGSPTYLAIQRGMIDVCFPNEETHINLQQDLQSLANQRKISLNK